MTDIQFTQRDIVNILKGSASDMILSLDRITAPERDLELLVDHIERMLAFAIQLRNSIPKKSEQKN